MYPERCLMIPIFLLAFFIFSFKCVWRERFGVRVSSRCFCSGVRDIGLLLKKSAFSCKRSTPVHPPRWEPLSYPTEVQIDTKIIRFFIKSTTFVCILSIFSRVFRPWSRAEGSQCPLNWPIFENWD